MRTILEELWYGNICFESGPHKLSKEAKKLMGYISNHYDELYSILNDEQKKIFQKLDDCHSELADINEREIFVYAFCLGARIAIEVMSLEIE